MFLSCFSKEKSSHLFGFFSWINNNPFVLKYLCHTIHPCIQVYSQRHIFLLLRYMLYHLSNIQCSYKDILGHTYPVNTLDKQKPQYLHYFLYISFPVQRSNKIFVHIVLYHLSVTGLRTATTWSEIPLIQFIMVFCINYFKKSISNFPIQSLFIEQPVPCADLNG